MTHITKLIHDVNQTIGKLSNIQYKLNEYLELNKTTYLSLLPNDIYDICDTNDLIYLYRMTYHGTKIFCIYIEYMIDSDIGRMIDYSIGSFKYKCDIDTMLNYIKNNRHLFIGNTGAIGEVGAIGATGTTGAGQPSATGNTGNIGNTGATGNIGNTRATGEVAATGNNGNKLIDYDIIEDEILYQDLQIHREVDKKVMINKLIELNTNNILLTPNTKKIMGKDLYKIFPNYRSFTH
jgi:hypothetical protein